MSSPRPLIRAACLALAAATVAAPVAARADGPVTGTATLSADRSAPTIDTWGFDLKQTGPGDATTMIDSDDPKASADYIDSIFGDGHLTLVRIPVRPDLDIKGGLHPFYRRYATAVRRIQHRYPDVKVFASKVSVQCGMPYAKACPAQGSQQLPDYPAKHIEHHGGDLTVDPAWYATYLATLVAQLDAAGAHVNVLGPDNEGDTLSGKDGLPDNADLTGARFQTLIKDIARTLTAKHPKVVPPRISALDSAAPSGPYLKTVNDAGKPFSIASTHFNSQKYDCEAGSLAGFQAQAAGWGAIWDTELHYTNLLDPEPGRAACARDYLPGNHHDTRNRGFLSAKLALISAFQGFQHDVTGVIWWSYRPGDCATGLGDTRTQIMSALVASTDGASRVTISGVPHRLSTADGTFGAYAFANPARRTISTWLINDTAQPQVETIALPASAAKRITSVRTTQWHDFAAPAGTRTADAQCGPATVGLDGLQHKVLTPPGSVTLVVLAAG